MNSWSDQIRDDFLAIIAYFFTEECSHPEEVILDESFYSVDDLSLSDADYCSNFYEDYDDCNEECHTEEYYDDCDDDFFA